MIAAELDFGVITITWGLGDVILALQFPILNVSRFGYPKVLVWA